MAKKDIKQEVKEVEQPVEKIIEEVPAAIEVKQPSKVHFSVWWATMSKKLPGHHAKEIILADFKARGLSMHESMGTFNKALEQYGIKLG